MSGAQSESRRVFGRRRGKTLRPGQQQLIETLLPRLTVPVDTLPPETEPREFFADAVKDIWLEVGFGKGEHLARQAESHPGVGIIGCEPFLDGVAALLRRIEAAEIENIRILPDDARLLLERLAPATLGRVFILFPDPWPKTRHHKRRFIQDETLALLARVMKPGAELRIATDHPDLAVWILSHMRRQMAFEWRIDRPADCLTRPPDWPGTRYEEKAIRDGRRPVYLRYRRANPKKSS